LKSPEPGEMRREDCNNKKKEKKKKKKKKKKKSQKKLRLRVGEPGPCLVGASNRLK
jgi:hypothetical protein